MAKPTLALIPASQGSKVFSVLPSSGVGDFDFSRGSAATRINSLGLIENVASGQSRLEYPLIDGVVNGCPSLLLEPQRTNLITYSEDFSNWFQIGSPNITSNYGVSPDGTQNSSRLQMNASDKIYINVASSGDISFTVYLKGVGQIRLRDNTSTGLKDVTLTNEWVRYELNFNATISNFQIEQQTGVSDFEIYGAQLEAGSYPTSYIPTNGTTVTRAAETANGAGDASTFNDSEGVLMAEISALANDGTYRMISLSDGSVNNSTNIQYSGVSNTIRTRTENAGVTQTNITYIVSSTIVISKMAVLYKSNQFELWLNGFKVGEDTLGTPPTGINKLSFDSGNGSNPFYGKTKQIQYYNSALTDSELEQLTSWTSFSDMANGQQYSIK